MVRQLVRLVRRHIVLYAPELWRRVRRLLVAATRFDLGEGLASRLENGLAAGHLAPSTDDHVAIGPVELNGPTTPARGLTRDQRRT